MTEPTLFDSLAFVERIESLMKDSESVDVEFKSAKGGFPGGFWETYSAFANTQGGTIIFGVKEKDGTYSIDHLTQKDTIKYRKEFWNNVNNKQVVNTNILKDSDVQEGEYEDSFVLVFNIPRANRSQKPVYLKNSSDNTYKRNYEGDYKCSSDEVRRMFADADIEHPKDSRILEGFAIEEDIDKESLNQYRQRFASIRPDHPWLLLDDKGLLTKLKGYRIDKKSKQEGLTLSGLLMFGKYDSIKDPDCCPAYFPDYREYFSTNPEDRWTDRIYPDGTWEANLFQFYTKVNPRLSAVLPKPFALKNGIRVEDTPTHIALREAFVNTLIHCDYTVDSNITIELHRDRYIFSNPGSLLISIHQYYQGGESVCRNKSLQQMFMQIGSAETAGSGVNKILQGWKVANFRSPQVEEKINPDKVVLELPLVSLLSNEVIDYLKELFGNKIESI
ncbi:MAG: putative DNA binding domain-containing protein, partial [Alistipes sp.]